tara:strand:+ start:2713 stop:3543 length:831 start_codon:yes stop_codon:yes gene_type:complete
MTNVTVLTTFHKPGMEQYGQRFINSFAEKVDKKIKLLVYVEECMPDNPDPDQIKILYAKQVLTKLNEFKTRWANDPRANGIPPDNIKARRPRDWHKKFKWDAVRFANKTYAVFDACKNNKDSWVVWMDADTFVHADWSYENFVKFLPSNAWMCYLGRGIKWPECGFYGLNMEHKVAHKFIKKFENMYEDAENGIFSLEEWHDSFVFEEVRKVVQDKNPQARFYNISGNLINGEGHPVINSDLGAYIDHLKGDRKEVGKSTKPQDLMVERTEDYWLK